MLNFTKGFNNQNNTNNTYSKFGRRSVDEIRQEMLQAKMNNRNKIESDKMKTVEQKNNGMDTYNKLNAFRNLNK